MRPGVRRKPSPSGPFRSMRWLRRTGLGFRVRAALLLVAFAIGSIFARDALLVQQTMLLRAELQHEITTTESEVPAFAEPPSKVKVRPSGLSRRTAMNPWDPPDDDDELDQDSDTTAAAASTLAVLPAVRGEILDCPFVESGPRSVTARAPVHAENRRLVLSRGPPV